MSKNVGSGARTIQLNTSYSHDLFDEYTRRQYVAKAPDRNPFGTDESPAKFDDFDALLKVWLPDQDSSRLR
jgi:hypothetical protein